MKKIICLGITLCLLILVGCDGEPLSAGGAHLWIDRAEVISLAM